MTAKDQTKAHIGNVQKKIYRMEAELDKRAFHHDKSKLVDPEASVFEEYTEKLKGMSYGSEEYKQCLKEMKPALDHHYQYNRHHPECHPDGIDGMNLVDLVEMFCDWMAAVERHNDGNIFRSIEINESRFAINPQLSAIFRNTAREIFGKEDPREKETP